MEIVELLDIHSLWPTEMDLCATILDVMCVLEALGVDPAVFDRRLLREYHTNDLRLTNFHYPLDDDVNVSM